MVLNPKFGSMTEVVKLTQRLVQQESITPNDADCQKIIAEILANIGFHVEQKKFNDVDNILIWHGEGDDGMFFLGHTDVVPVGNENDWKHPPFSANIENNNLYGRGSADMKGSVAAMVLALKEFKESHPNHSKKIGLMLTSDEEGKAVDGVKKMMPHILKEHKFKFCLVGEPSSSQKLGDVVRIGRRGSLHVKIKIHGIQGHVAYPEKAENPVFASAPLITELASTTWDKPYQEFPPTSFQISSVKTSTNVANIIPGQLEICANFRYSPTSNQASLESKLIKILESHTLKYDLEWTLSGEPFYNQCPEFKSAVNQSIEKITGNSAEFNAGGGTSDGRFVAPYGVHVMELGPINATIHQVDECVNIDDLENLRKIYSKILTKLCL